MRRGGGGAGVFWCDVRRGRRAGVRSVRETGPAVAVGLGWHGEAGVNACRQRQQRARGTERRTHRHGTPSHPCTATRRVPCRAASRTQPAARERRVYSLARWQAPRWRAGRGARARACVEPWTRWRRARQGKAGDAPLGKRQPRAGAARQYLVPLLRCERLAVVLARTRAGVTTVSSSVHGRARTGWRWGTSRCCTFSADSLFTGGAVCACCAFHGKDFQKMTI